MRLAAERRKSILSVVLTTIVGAAAFGGLFYLADEHDPQHYLLFHVLAEVFAITIAGGVFMVAWNSRRFGPNSYLQLLGIAMLFIGVLGALHTLAYGGMAVLTDSGAVFPLLGDGKANTPTQLWIASRYIQGITFLIAPLFIGRRLWVAPAMAIYALAMALLLCSILWWGVFPDCFTTKVTDFKVVSELIVCGMLLGGIAGLLWKRRAFEPKVLRLLVAAMIVAIASELFFTSYSRVMDHYNAIGHFLQIVSFYLVYRAIIVTGLSRPFDLLLRDLKTNAEALRALTGELETRVQERTADLQRTVQALQAEMNARREVEAARLKLAEMLEASDEAIVSETADGTILSWNAGAQKLYGYLAAEMIGKNIETIIPREFQKENDEMRRLAAAGQRVAGIDTFRICKGGRQVMVSVNLHPVRNAQGQVIALAAIARDITEQRRLESEVLKAGELERQRIGHDLHDTLGQHLTGTSFLSSVLRRKLADRQAPETEEAESIENLLVDAVAMTRAMARGLSPLGLKDGSLGDALKQLAQRAQDMYQVQCTLNADPAVQVSDIATATHLYRITQEAINNAVKHGKARQIGVELGVRDGSAFLSIYDDGTGLPKELPAERGLGLRIMDYRAKTIGGSLSISRRDEHGGTSVVCTLPRSCSLGQPAAE